MANKNQAAAPTAAKQTPPADPATKPGAGSTAPAPSDITSGIASGTVKPKRTRNALSPQKQFAIMIAGLMTIFQRKELAAQLTEPEKAQIASASKAAEELNAQTIAPVRNQIQAIRVELGEHGKALQQPNADLGKIAAAVSELNKELVRKEKQLTQLQAAPAA